MDATRQEALLRSRYDQYRQDHAAWRAARKTFDLVLLQAASDALLVSRVALYEALVADGWEAPAHERAVLERDAALVAFDRLEPETVVRLVEQASAR